MPADTVTGRRPAGPVAWTVATVLGIGHAPVASGTVATLVAVPMVWGADALGGWLLVLALTILLSAAGVAASGALESALGHHDPSEVVIDEVAGYFVTMLFVPSTPMTLAAGFLLFRALDILKPWPASRAERWPGGWGIMADDLVCGVMANLLLQSGVILWG